MKLETLVRVLDKENVSEKDLASVRSFFINTRKINTINKLSVKTRIYVQWKTESNLKRLHQQKSIRQI